MRSAVRALPTNASAGGHTILFVFDAWSARNVDLFGYPRQTMPNLARFAQSADVFTQHHSAATFTTPGVTTLLSGLHPITHRANTIKAILPRAHANQTIFQAAQGRLNTVGYSQNPYADQLLGQAQGQGSLRQHIRRSSFNSEQVMLFDAAPFGIQPFQNDSYTAYNAFDSGMATESAEVEGSLILGPALAFYRRQQTAKLAEQLSATYPTDIPEAIEQFTIKDTVNGMITTLQSLQEPSLVYFHIIPPHAPYAPYQKYKELFEQDGYQPQMHSTHPLVGKRRKKSKKEEIARERALYDAYLASLDEELASLFGYLQSSGLKENSNIVFTADHGELFDHGNVGHNCPLLSEPLIHVPLIISKAGQQSGARIDQITSSTDVMPTLCALAGLPVPDWAEGHNLYSPAAQDPSRAVFSFDGREQNLNDPFNEFGLSVIRNGKKAIHYWYGKELLTEYYDLRNDPDEMTNLFGKRSDGFANVEALLREKEKTMGVDLPV